MTPTSGDRRIQPSDDALEQRFQRVQTVLLVGIVDGQRAYT